MQNDSQAIPAIEESTAFEGSTPSRAFIMSRNGVRLVPRKPKRPCSYTSCPHLTDGRFCEEHQKQENKYYEKYQRSPQVKKRYGYQWRKIRAKFVKDNPLCVKCLEQDRLTPVEEVHHILPLSKGGTHDVDNLMALCKSCHSKITAEEGDRWRNW